MSIKTAILGSCLLASASVSCTDNTWITVFVHGIMIVKPYLVLTNTFQLMTDEIRNTTYAATLHNMRHDPFFYKNQAMQEFGLQPVDLTCSAGNASGALASAYDAVARHVCDQQCTNHYYTFGWAALLSHSQRVLDAAQLYDELSQVVNNLRAQNIEPKIRLVGYSHGGNVCLNLAAVKKERNEEKPFTVTQLVLLGTPIQPETDFLVADSMFDNVYHLYSQADHLQKLDFFSFHRFFSNRIFGERTDFSIPEKVHQVRIRVTRDRCAHKCAPQATDYTNERVVTGTVPFLRKSCPGHTELWFFAWTPDYYRKSFALNPLPVASMIPLLVNEIDQFRYTHGHTPDVIDLRPAHGTIIVRNKAQHKTSVRPFIPQDTFDQMRQKALAYAPAEYSKTEYNTHIWAAYEKATTQKSA